jgi:1-acyl-sn-glycerol-3-phosphate acyltransferase
MMAFLRSVLHLVFMTVTVVPWAVLCIVSSVFLSGKRMYWLCEMWLACAMWGLKVICGVQFRVSGRENLPVGELSQAILLVKHTSTLETFLMPTLIPQPLAYVFKRELLYIPFFGWTMARMDMIHIDRSKRAEAFSKVVAQGKRLLSNGTWVIMFPEGTRQPRGVTGAYKLGGARLAVETGAPVVPVAVTSAKCWPRKAFIKRPGVVDVSIGPLMPSAGRTPEDLMADVQTWIEAEMRRLDPEGHGLKA